LVDVSDESLKVQDSVNDHPAPEGISVTLLQRNDGWCFHFGIIVENEMKEVLPIVVGGETEAEAMASAAEVARNLADEKGGRADYTGTFMKLNTKEQ
jgi:hypothetical protein